MLSPASRCPQRSHRQALFHFCCYGCYGIQLVWAGGQPADTGSPCPRPLPTACGRCTGRAMLWTAWPVRMRLSASPKAASMTQWWAFSPPEGARQGFRMACSRSSVLGRQAGMKMWVSVVARMLQCRSHSTGPRWLPLPMHISKTVHTIDGYQRDCNSAPKNGCFPRGAHQSQPQHSIVPSVRTPQVWSKSHATDFQGPGGGDPSPARLYPQHTISPLLRSAQA